MSLSDVVLMQNTVYSDGRGYFVESFNAKTFKSWTGLNLVFVQDNHSRSARNVLRGIHYQRAPHEQGKLVRVVKGAVFDVAVDLRRESASFGKWVGYELRENDGKSLWIPPGFGHAFVALEDETDFLYKVTDYRHSTLEVSIAWDDQDLQIKWPIKDVIMSEKDRSSISLEGFING